MDGKTKLVIKKAINTANDVTNTKAMLEFHQNNFKTQMSGIEEMTGFALWRRDDKRFYWRDNAAKVDSIIYPSAVEALFALMNNLIEWK